MIPKTIEKALRGLPVEDLVTLINLCCTQGVRSQSYTDDQGRMGRYTHWDYEAIGITVRFEQYKDMSPSFRLIGQDWAVSFVGYRGSVADIALRGKDRVEICIGPLDETNLTNWRLAPVPQKFDAWKFRRRGSLDAFKSDLSLLRMTL